MKNADIIDVAEICRQWCAHPGESPDFARGVANVIYQLATLSEAGHPGLADKLREIATDCR